MRETLRDPGRRGRPPPGPRGPGPARARHLVGGGTAAAGPRPLPRDRPQGPQPAVLRRQARRSSAAGHRRPRRHSRPQLRGPGRARGPGRGGMGRAARADPARLRVANFSRVYEAPRDLEGLGAAVLAALRGRTRRFVPGHAPGARTSNSRCVRPRSTGAWALRWRAATGASVDLDDPQITIYVEVLHDRILSRSSACPAPAASPSARRAACWHCSRAGSTRRWPPGA